MLGRGHPLFTCTQLGTKGGLCGFSCVLTQLAPFPSCNSNLGVGLGWLVR